MYAIRSYYVPAPRVRIHPRRRVLGIGHAQEVEHHRELLAEVLAEQEQAAGDLLARALVPVPLADAEEVPEQLQDRDERDPLAVRDAARLVRGEPARAAALEELEAEPALARPRFRDDADLV